MKIFLVGGCVRDEIIGRNFSDRDFVVVGATEEEFLSKYPEAKKVGNSFPVYLVNNEEYAFARAEKKKGHKHTDFEVIATPDISLEHDLARRDFTINAIAKDLETGEFIDPFNGLKDIENKIIRHVTDAFLEDPLRVYRAARFAAQFPDFSIADETKKLIKTMKNELLVLSEERVWKEFEKALYTKAPWRFVEILLETDLLEVHFPEFLKLSQVIPGPEKYHQGEKDTLEHTFNVLKKLKIQNAMLNFAAFFHDIGKIVTPKEELPRHYGHDKNGVEIILNFCQRLKVPKCYEKSAVMASLYHMKAPKLLEMRPKTAIDFLTILKKFPAGGIRGFFELVNSDARGTLDKLIDFTEYIKPVLELKLEDKFKNQGKKSGEILMMQKIKLFKEMKKEWK